MGSSDEASSTSLFVAYPRIPIPGALAVVVPGPRLDEVRQLEGERRRRVWTLRAIVADSIPLGGTLPEMLARDSRSGLFLNGQRLTIYLHYGGERAIYYELIGDDDGRLLYIEVQVEAALPNIVFLFGRRAFNELLDAVLRIDRTIPLVVQRLDLLSPRDGGLLAHEVVYPVDRAIRLGPLGGMEAWDAFAPYEAILREATTTTSPFYRLLCAYRAYEGTRLIRKWLKRQAKLLGVIEQLPGDPPIDETFLAERGLASPGLEGIHTAADLFKRLKTHRDAVAHFFLDKTQTGFIHLADAETIREYDLASSLLLDLAGQEIESLRTFCSTHLWQLRRGSILPTVEMKDRFVVRTPHD